MVVLYTELGGVKTSEELKALLPNTFILLHADIFKLIMAI